MGTTKKKVPVVTYELLPVFERKANNAKVAAEYRAEEKKLQNSLFKTKEENERRLAEKKALYQRIVVPFSVFEERAKRRELALVEKYKQKRIQEDILREERNWAYQVAKFYEMIQLEKVVPIEIRALPELYKKSEIGKAELIECEKSIVPVLTKFAQIIGFEVELDEFEEMTALLLWKPYPYWMYAFSGEKKDVVPKGFKK
jgi:hypothetical protein